MTIPWLSRRIRFVFATVVITLLTTKILNDLYEHAGRSIRELAGVPALVPAAQGTLSLAAVPESRCTVRERYLLFFTRTWYRTTYRVEIENHDALPPIDGRLVVDCTGARVAAFEPNPLLDPAPAPGGQTAHAFHARYRDAVDPFAIDLRLPPPGARLCASLTVVSRRAFAGDSALALELGHPGGVLHAVPVPVLWTSAE